MDRPNVVLICVDQWRGDALSAAGHPVVRTPYLDELARAGTRFSRAYSATPTCIPARVALLTGQSQEAHGRTGYLEGVPFDRAHPVTLPRTLRDAGYQTRAVGKMHVAPARSRVGFDDVRLHDGYLRSARQRDRRDLAEVDDYIPWLRRQAGASAVVDYTDHGVNCNSLIARPWDKPEALHPTSWVVTEGIEWLYRRDPTAPFFLYLSFVAPHPPYTPPQWAFEQYLAAPREDPPVGDWVGDYRAHRRDGAHDAHVGRSDPETHHRARAGYYGHMAHIDQQVNRFLEALGEFGLSDSTSVLFVSDHGEMMGDHDMQRKGFPYEGSAHVPLIVRLPDADGAPGVVDEVVELRDVMPTVLDLAGVDVPPGVDGRSLVPFLRGERPEWRADLHGEHVLFGQSLQWVTDGKRKFVWMSGEGHEQFFDLESDPHELHDLARAAPDGDEVTAWRSRLVEHLRGREEGFVEHDRLVPGRSPTAVLSHARAAAGLGSGPAEEGGSR